MVIGKLGIGKIVLINFLFSQVQKYELLLIIFFFDKDCGVEIFVCVCGGNYLVLENGVLIGFNLFQCDNNEVNVQFLVDLIKVLVGKCEYSVCEEEDIYCVVESMFDMLMYLCSMINFQKSLFNMGDDGFYVCMCCWILGNLLGWVFDNFVDIVDLSRVNIIGFDYIDIIDNFEVCVLVINYLLYCLELLIDGCLLIYVMDEFWKILDGEGGLKEFVKNKQKIICKQNGLGIFVMQSLEDVLKSDIFVVLIEQIVILILLLNLNVSKSDYMDGLKLIEVEFKVVIVFDECLCCFLVKQGYVFSVCQFNLCGMDDILLVILVLIDNIDIMYCVLQIVVVCNWIIVDEFMLEQWLEDFYKY